MQQPEVYISHAWGGESDKVMMKIVKRLEKERIQVVYDHKDLKYRGSISNFMNELGKAKAVILIVSNKYLRSEYCMFELLQIYENNHFLHRIFPVVLDEVQIAKSTDRLDLVKYWEQQQDELEQKIRELRTLAHIEGITEDLNLYTDIRKHIAKFTYILRDINTLNTKQHYDENFESLIVQMREALTTERETPKMSPLEWSEKMSKKMPWRAFGALAFILSFGMLIYFMFFMPEKSNPTGALTNPFLSWEGKWKQEMESRGEPIRGTIDLIFADNVLRGKVKNIYPDKGPNTTSLLTDISINASGEILKGKWRNEDTRSYGTFEWHLDEKRFKGYYTYKESDQKYWWNGRK